MQKLQPSLPNIGPTDSVSIYQGELTPLCVIECSKKLKSAFPQIAAGFYDILNDRLKANGFNDARLRAAIDNLIDTFNYPIPTISDIISFDRRLKFLSYYEMCDLVGSYGEKVWKDHKRLKNGMYAKLSDAEKYKLE
jgi:hypothetical protein